VTLNVLERLLLDFDGSVLLVTHDRYFLDKVATAILAFEGEGRITRWEGNYDLYRRLKAQAEAARTAADAAGAGANLPLPRGAGDPSTPRPLRDRSAQGERAVGVRGSPPANDDAGPTPRRKPGKLSFKEQRELEGMEAAILAAEERKAALEAALADPETYRKDGAAVAGLKVDLDAASAEVERLYARWQELDAIKSAGS
jgi:ATP-binding cassette subfamily F protein uup